MCTNPDKQQNPAIQLAKSGSSIICPLHTACIVFQDKECSSDAITAEFLNLRARLLLLKQNRVVGLERKLHKIDRDEDTPLFLGSSQCDQNKEREKVLAEADEAIEDLDKFILRSRRISELEDADPRAVTNLQNWIDGTGCIARAESRFLNYPPEELLGISPQDESAMIGLQSTVAENLLRLRDCFFESYRSNVSRDSTHIYIPKRSSAALVSRALMTPIIVVMLLTPVILCSYLDSTSSRLFAIGGATVVFIAIISSATRMKSHELIVAGATYATVLVVFFIGIVGHIAALVDITLFETASLLQKRAAIFIDYDDAF
ncbi:hypothetical protein NM208_g13109 [Fusarium decemcellulare]|uniref:Uncharacterized protein n=1 Tax=Fusarium decemcellulare TaxID=57161 RepID=A0ACC1RMY7_9HYPO|nr:hypothetical protein NM208_g13109 [Fusarium decemcellulare]